MPSRRRLLCGLGSLGAAGLAGCADGVATDASPGTDADTEWPQPGGTDRFDCYRRDAAAPRKSPDERWTTGTVWPDGRPLVAAGSVILPTQGGAIAYDLDSGAERWRFGFDDGSPDVRTPPVVVDGVAYLGTRTGLTAVDIGDGTGVWTAEFEASATAPPVVGLDRERLVVGTVDGLVGLDVDGERLWRRETFTPVSALASWGDRLYAGTEGGELLAYYDLQGPNGMWRRQLDGRVIQVALLDGDGVVVSTFGGPVTRRDDQDTGAARWSHEAGTHGFVVGGDTYAVGGGLAAVHTRTSERQWAVDDRLRAAPAGAGDTVYTGGDGFVAGYAMGGGTGLEEHRVGAERFRHDVDGVVATGVSVGDGAVFAAAQNDEGEATLYALE